MFKWKKDEEGLEGEGRADDYFEGVWTEPIDRLVMEIFRKTGLKDFTFIRAVCPEGDVQNEGLPMGWVFVLNTPDDAILELYKDRKPLAAFYASYRGRYQAGAYIHEEGKFYYASDALDDGKKDIWFEQDSICGQIARDSLLKINYHHEEEA